MTDPSPGPEAPEGAMGERPPADELPETVLPVTAPSRAELWRRVRLCRSVLAQRDATAETVALALRVLDGESLADLAHREVE